MARFLLFISLIINLLATSSAQTVSLRGEVKSTDGAVIGATIRLLSTPYAAISDVNGQFEIKEVPPGSYTLEIRSVGFKAHTQRILVTAESIPMKISLIETTLTMDEIVVSGSMQPTFVSQSPVKIDIVTANYLNTYLPGAASSLIEGVSLVNGVQEVVACGVCFTNNISINGLPGPYTAVLMDGMPMYGNLASVYGLNGIPNMIIDRFEIIKGPSSTLYGSEAVAGVINIITKDPATQPSFSFDVMGTSHLETFGNLAIAPKVGKSAGFIGVNHAFINEFLDRNEDGFSDLVNLDRVSLFTKWNIHRPSGRKFSVAAKYYYEDRRNGVEAYLRNRAYRQLRGSDEIYGESIYTNRVELFGSYDLMDASRLRVDYSISTHRQDSYYGADRYLASQDIFFANLIWSPVLENHQFTTGLTTRYQLYDDNTPATQPGSSTLPTSQYIPGIFIQDEWTASKRFTLLGGARLDHYYHHGFIFAPRLNAKYKAGQWTTLRSNFGTGFRVVNLFTEDHAFVTGQREVVIAQNLKPEESYSWSFNLNHVYTIRKSQGMFDVDLYYTYFTNKITPNYDMVATQILYANSQGHAVSRGIGINIQQELQAPLAFNLGFNFQEVTERTQGEKRHIEFAPRWSGVFAANYTFHQQKVNVAYNVRITGPMALPEVYDLDDQGNLLGSPRPTDSKAYAIHGLQVTHDIRKGWAVYGGIQNIFDFMQPWSPLVGFNDPTATPGFSQRFDTSYAYAPIQGREVYVGVRWGTGRK
jgi:outer membrane receptor for ferrienterochelin and colicins